jgi:hypothetical protein
MVSLYLAAFYGQATVNLWLVLVSRRGRCEP